MKQTVLDWYLRNHFKFWKIENSKGKVIADNAVNKENSNPDNDGNRLLVELDSLERNPVAERYTINAVEKNGQDWKVYPFVCYGQSQSSNFGTGGGSAMDMAIMFGKMQSDLANQTLIWKMQQEKEKEERERNEGTQTGLMDTLKPLIPMLASSVAPVLLKGAFDLAEKSPAILSFLEKVTSNPTVQAGVMRAMETYFTPKTNSNPTYDSYESTGIEPVND